MVVLLSQPIQMLVWLQVKPPSQFNTDKGEAVFSTAAATRADQSAELNFPSDWNGDTVELYIGRYLVLSKSLFLLIIFYFYDGFLEE